jgi:tetratricopeptide (TPR) repeat protein
VSTTNRISAIQTIAARAQRKVHVLSSDIEKRWMVNVPFPVPKKEKYDNEIAFPEWNEALEKAKQGNLTESANLLEKVLDKMKGTYQEDNPAYIQVLDRLWKVYINSNNFTKAEQLAFKLLAIAEKLPKPNIPVITTLAEQAKLATTTPPDYESNMLNAYARIELVYRQQGKYDEAITWCNKMVDNTRYEKNMRGLGYALMELAVCYLRKAHSSTCDPNGLKHCQQTLVILDQYIKYDDPMKVRALTNLANYYYSIKSYDKADQFYKKGLDAAEKMRPEIVPVEEKAELLGNMGELKVDQKEYKKAEELLEQSLKLLEKVNEGRTEPNYKIFVTLHNLARAFQGQMNHTYAEGLYKRCIDLADKLEKTNAHPVKNELDAKTGKMYYDYSTLLKEKNRTAEANQMEEKAKGYGVTAATVAAMMAPPINTKTSKKKKAAAAAAAAAATPATEEKK